TQTPFLTYGILTVNLVLLLLLELSGGSENSETLMNFGAMNFQKFWAGDYYRVFAAMFLHIGAMHFVYNSLSLVIFGVRIERHYGRGTFLAVYIVTGLVGNYLNAMAEPQILLAGASGAIFGLMGAAVAITQYTKKYLDGLNLYTMLVFAFVGVSFGFLMPNVGNIAHIGGLASGYLMGMLILKIWGGHRSGENTANTQS
ncbi:MAG: rhomboid family intramembrane serine protease, partial [Clostridiales bacterium]|nr:rhomboid family intramembrane serine protease [Clostridiales bacterium]